MVREARRGGGSIGVTKLPKAVARRFNETSIPNEPGSNSLPVFKTSSPHAHGSYVNGPTVSTESIDVTDVGPNL